MTNGGVDANGSEIWLYPAELYGVIRISGRAKLRNEESKKMKAEYLGHVVFYVKDLESSLIFYRDLLGFQEVGRIFEGKAVALTSGRTHHELLLIQVGDVPGPSVGPRRGLYHIGIKIGESLEELREAKLELEQAGFPIDGMSDHTVSQSLYLKDPDGNEVEVYVDDPMVNWEDNPELVLSPIKPLHL